MARHVLGNLPWHATLADAHVVHRLLGRRYGMWRAMARYPADARAQLRDATRGARQPHAEQHSRMVHHTTQRQRQRQRATTR